MYILRIKNNTRSGADRNRAYRRWEADLPVRQLRHQLCLSPLLGFIVTLSERHSRDKWESLQNANELSDHSNLL